MLRWLALLCLCSAYIQGGLTKTLDWPGALGEMQHFGLAPAPFFAAGTIALELVAALMILTGRLRWVGALALAGFTAMATVLANRFWEMTGPERFAATNSFFEHVGLVGAFVLVAWYDLDTDRAGAAMSESPAAAPPPAGSFAPLRHTVFAVLWGATVLGNTGTFMRDVASGWLVTDLSASPAAVAAIQAAGTLPIFLLAIPAGVLSDILDRRRFLIAIQLMLAAVSLTLCILSLTGVMSVTALISLTFIGGIGAALMGPTWQSIVPELVPKAELKNAVALNSLGINIARAIGPAVGGVLIASFGASVTYGVDVASYGLVIAALLWWKRPKDADDGLAESFGGALRAGYRHARHSRELHVVLWRAFFFFAFASAIWALLPLIARQLLAADAGLLWSNAGIDRRRRDLGRSRVAKNSGAGRRGRADALSGLDHRDGDRPAVGCAPQMGRHPHPVGDGRRLDRGADHAQRDRAGCPAQLGSRPWPCGVPDGLQWRDGRRKPLLGLAGAEHRHILDLACGGRFTGRGRAAAE